MKAKLFIRRDTDPLLELGLLRPTERRRSSVVVSVEKFIERRRSSIGQYFLERLFGHEKEESVESGEWLEIRRKVREVEGKLNQRSTQQCRAGVRCINQHDDDDVPYELMGQVLVLSIIATLLLFAAIADMEGIRSV